jgi:uncharacterized membrane-anchored protein YhcB (DUF1043 family)
MSIEAAMWNLLSLGFMVGVLFMLLMFSVLTEIELHHQRKTAAKLLAKHAAEHGTEGNEK